MKRRSNTRKTKNSHSNEDEKKHFSRASDITEKRTMKYGAIAVMLEDELDEEHEDGY
ncbi:MAG: hypothetical protein JW814_01110 [Candidatus Krumholzibacteriota bacterium]|nr:hypothetical protein [Candidatus Krumholzibacteriota bacterium]